MGNNFKKARKSYSLCALHLKRNESYLLTKFLVDTFCSFKVMPRKICGRTDEGTYHTEIRTDGQNGDYMLSLA